LADSVEARRALPRDDYRDVVAGIGARALGLAKLMPDAARSAFSLHYCSACDLRSTIAPRLSASRHAPR